MHDVIKVSQSHGFLGWFLDGGVKLRLVFADNQSAMAISKSSVATRKSKHFALRYLMVQENFKSFGYCPSHLNLADPFTTALSGEKYKTIFDHSINDDEDGYASGLCAIVDLRNLL